MNTANERTKDADATTKTRIYYTRTCAVRRHSKSNPRQRVAAASPLRFVSGSVLYLLLCVMRAHSGVNMKGLHSRGNRDVVAWLVDEAAVFYLQLQVRFLKRTSSSEPPKQISPHFNTSAVANKKIGNLLLTCYHMRCCGGNLLQKNNMTLPC